MMRMFTISRRPRLNSQVPVSTVHHTPFLPVARKTTSTITTCHGPRLLAH
ncbi:hypothetical protein [Legionella antarctica]|nr:hypothetical protein [Legionella antarctica]